MKNIDEKLSGIGGMSAALPSEKREVRGRGRAAWLKKRLNIFRDWKRDWPDVGGVLEASAGGVEGCVRNIDAKMPGNGGGKSATAPFTKRDIRG